VGRIGEDTGAPGETLFTAEPVPEPDGSLLLEGLTRLDEFAELTGLRLEPALRGRVDTLGGLVMAELGRVPEVGDEVEVAGRRLRVEALDGRRVAAVRLLPPTDPTPAPAEEALNVDRP
jgi:putative hemolysin